jgi:hypothetical protein
MNTVKILVVALMAVGAGAGWAHADDGVSGQRRGRQPGPPAEAYAACEGKSVGDAAQFVTTRGATVTGTCELEGDRLVLRPDHLRGRPGGLPHAPPAEAYTACEGKQAGDAAQFVTPHGDTVSGTCEPEADRLVLRPDYLRGRSGGRRHGPPPEAYTACEGKNAGDPAQLTGRHGETVTGTCEQEKDRLVLRPDFLKNRALTGPEGLDEE